MNKNEEQMLALQLSRLEELIKEQAVQTDLKLKAVKESMHGLAVQIESNFDVLNISIQKDREMLTETRNNTRETNGRVLKLEKEKNDHILNCPRVSEIKDLNTKIESHGKAVEDLTFIQRHPMLFLSLVVATIIAIFYFKSLSA